MSFNFDFYPKNHYYHFNNFTFSHMLSFETLKEKKVTISFLIVSGLIIIFFLFYFISPHERIINKQDSEIVITYADNISAAHQLIIDRFNDEYKGKIRVKPIDLPFTKFSTNERKELLARSLRSKSPKLDIFAIDLIWSARFARWAEHLDDYVKNYRLEDILPAALYTCYYQNDLIAIPTYVDIGMMYYRRDLIQKLPNGSEIEKKLKESISWREFFELSNEFGKDNPFYIFPADNFEGLLCSFIEILFYKNIDFFKPDKIDWQSEELKYTLNFLFDFIHKYKISPEAVTDFKDNSCYSYFANNNGVFLRGWPSFMKDYKNLLRSKEIDELLESAALPHFEGMKPHSVIGGWNIMLSKYSENKAEAIEFIKFILSEESQKTLYEFGAYLPVLTSVYEDANFLKNYPELGYNKKLLDNGVHRPFLENYTKISDVISYYTNQVLKKNLSIEEALNKTEESLESGELIVR